MFPSGFLEFIVTIFLPVTCGIPLVVLLGLYLHHRYSESRTIAKNKLGEVALAAVERAIAHWNRAYKPEDDEWCAAFTSFGEALNLAPEDEICDYMHSHSWGAIDLYCRHRTERELWDFGGAPW